MLKRGGSAADAAIAANALLGFVEPVSSGLGGDCFAFVWDPKAGKLEGMASSGRSPKLLSLAAVRSRAKDGVLPKLGAVTVSTPVRSMAGGRCTSATESSSGQSCSSRPFITVRSALPCRQIIGFYLKRNMAAFLHPGSGVEETANAVATYTPGGIAPTNTTFAAILILPAPIA